MPLKWRTPQSERSARSNTRSPMRASFDERSRLAGVEVERQEVALGVVVGGVEERLVVRVERERGDD